MSLAGPYLPVLSARWEQWCALIEPRLRRLPWPVFASLAAVIALGLSVLCFGPKFWLWRQQGPGTFEWARAISVWQQVQGTAATADSMEAALRWRLLPVLVLRAAGGGWWAVLALPWIGLVGLMFATATYLERSLADRTTVILGCVLLATSGGIITLTTLLGLNDAWYLLPLVAVVFSASPGVVALAGLCGPWVDERFLLALPLAWLCRCLVFSAESRRAALFALLPGPTFYVLVRLGVSVLGHEAASADFVVRVFHELPVYLPYVPLGWWMGYRLGWLLLALMLVRLWTQDRPRALRLGLAAAAAMVAVTFVSADLTRCTNLLFPLLLAGLLPLQRAMGPARLRLALAAVTAGNLLLPFAWVTYNKVSPVWPGPVELWRLWR